MCVACFTPFLGCVGQWFSAWGDVPGGFSSTLQCAESPARSGPDVGSARTETLLWAAECAERFVLIESSQTVSEIGTDLFPSTFF